ncbi:hypothetical protein [Streptacidiphilus cavernicola]|uniref:Portal protein n=1 Tax=Streptacidiphilus cavernicola TaxID=3342716 RepID=A0ABV6VYU1_9ACTN
MEWPKILRHERGKFKAVEVEGGVQLQPIGMAVMASAALVSQAQVSGILQRQNSWQTEAWELYDQVGELRFGLEWLANACSRVRFYPGRVDPDGSTEVTRLADDDPLREDLRAPLVELFGAAVGQAEMIRRFVTHLSIPGESYLVGFPDPDTEKRRWVVCSREEIRANQLGNGKVDIQLPDRPGRTTLDLESGESVMIRLWRPHPKIAIEPDSAMIPLRSVLREVLSLSAHIAASADSRLAGAGIIAIPDEITTPDSRQSDGVNPIHPDPFTAALITAMITPLKNRDSASAVAPMVLRGPAAAIDKIKYLTFSTPFDERVSPMRDNALRRMATGIDIPAEVVLGLGDTSHWNAWTITESALQVAVSPIMGLLCEALTSQFYRPALKALDVEDVEGYAIGFDITPLAKSPDRGPDAQAAHDRILLSDAALLRELGFDEEDMPSEQERLQRLAEKLISAQPQLAPYLLPLLGFHIPPAALAAIPQPAAPVTVERDGTEPPADGQQEPADAEEQHPMPSPPTRLSKIPVQPRRGHPALAASALPPQAPAADVPSDADQLASAILTAAAQAERWRTTALEIGVLRALERAGQWLLNAYGRTYRGQLKDVPLHEIHTKLAPQENWLDKMLEGAHRELTASLSDQPCLVEAVDRYVRALLLYQHPHAREYLSAAVEQAGCADAAA